MPKKTTPTFRDFAVEYLSHMRHQRAKGTLKLYNSYIWNYCVPEFGELHLSSIGKPEVTRWIAKLRAANKSEVVIKAAFVQLRTMMNYAADELEYIPSWGVKIRSMSGDKSKPRPTFTATDYNRVMRHLPAEHRPIFDVIAGSALRISEVAGLDVGDWDPVARTLTVQRQYYLGEVKSTKTGTVEKVWPLPLAAEALDQLTADREPWEALFRLHGTRMKAHYIRDLWATARARAGLPNFHVHDLRHLGLSVYAQSGATLAEVMAHGRHRDRTSALRYQHVGTEERRLQLSKLAGAAFSS